MDKRFDRVRDATQSAGRWEEHRARFDAYLRGLTFSREPRLLRLVEAMRYSMLGGGKRVRPTLCMEVATVFGAEPGLVLPSAAAIELIHTYSLIHDDLPAMDDDDFRRGRPTVHKKYGEAMAILTGDAFFGESLTLITVHQEGSPEQILEVVRELAGSTGVNGMVGGQVIDMDQTGVGEAVDPEQNRCSHKEQREDRCDPGGRRRVRAGGGIGVRDGAGAVFPDRGRRPGRHLDARGPWQERGK
jgi:geranylgeranyl diphosphate synthase type II